ncbi:MAG: hypothetical protein ACJAQ4_001582 [Cryomorphaceae bacterium]
MDEQQQLKNAVQFEGLKADLSSINSERYENNQGKKNPFLIFPIAAQIAVLISFSF